MMNPLAFPSSASLSQSGMSLRDYFAAKALSGLISHPATQGPPSEFAVYCYKIADAMLAERAKDSSKEAS